MTTRDLWPIFAEILSLPAHDPLTYEEEDSVLAILNRNRVSWEEFHQMHRPPFRNSFKLAQILDTRYTDLCAVLEA